MFPSFRKPITSPSRRLTPKEQALAEDIIKAWTEPGVSPQFHERRKDMVRGQMPILALRLDSLAQEMDR